MSAPELAPRPSARRFTVAVAVVALLVGILPAPALGQASEPATYRNPVSKEFADTFADPAVILAKDGWWYSYGTTDPLREGEGVFHTIPMARSRDLVTWEYVGDAFDEPTDVSWAADDAALWAPDIRYLDGTYYLYYVVTQTTVTDEANDNAVGVATAPSPTGPWTDSGAPVVGPRRVAADNFLWTFDPSQFTDTDGTKYLYYGSYYGGVFVTELSADGTRAVGEPTMVAIDNRYEGAYVIKRGRYYYFFGSSANCCAGPTTGYSVYAGRSTSPRGPFVDRAGDSLLESRVGGTLVISMNGNRWVGTGHNAVVTDLAGQDWLAYHAIDRRDPYLDEPFGINERPMLIDRLDWIDGWPTVRAGRWASAWPRPAPVTSRTVGGDLNAGGDLDDEWRRTGGWRRVGRAGSGFARQFGTNCLDRTLTTRDDAPGDRRVEADLRLASTSAATAAGLVSARTERDTHAVSWLDAEAGALVTQVTVDGDTLRRRTSGLPADFAYDEWHNVAAELRGRTLVVEVTDARLNDPVAVQRLLLPVDLRGPAAVGVATRCGRADADNVGAVALHNRHSRRAPDPKVGMLDAAFSDEFDDEMLDDDWEWVREPDGRETGGVFRWPTQRADLVGTGNDASVLLRDAPAGNYVAETKLTIDLGVGDVRNFQQGGMVAYVHDDLWTRLSHVAIFNTRQTEFGKEQPFADATAFGGTLIGPPADTTWLRLAHRVDPNNGEHEYRAASSRDGQDWVWGGVWTLPAGTDPRIGLISHGWFEGPQATAEFEYFRVYTP